MNETGKSGSFLGFLGETRDVLADLLLNQPRLWFEEARLKTRDLPKTNFELGCMFADQGKWFDAIFRFRITLFLQPNYPNASYNLGYCYFRMGKKPQAVVALRDAWKLNPAHAETAFMLTMLDPSSVPVDRRPQQMPRSMVTDFFTSISERYDALEAQNQYQGGRMVHEQLKRLSSTNMAEVVDLGCGSGIAARPWRSNASRIVGVDLTPAMVNVARDIANEKGKLFDSVIEADITAPGDALNGLSADLALAVNVAQFIGALDGFFAAAGSALKTGGIFAVTVEPWAGSGGFGLNAATGRFGHTASYVKQVATAAGFASVGEAQLSIYPASQAQLFILRKDQH